jgi:hypothetical protein
MGGNLKCAVGTLDKRTTRFVLLLHLPQHHLGLGHGDGLPR